MTTKLKSFGDLGFDLVDNFFLLFYLIQNESKALWKSHFLSSSLSGFFDFSCVCVGSRSSFIRLSYDIGDLIPHIRL